MCNDNRLRVTKQCKLKFAITSKFVDEVEFDVVPLDICGIVLGSPYLYDRKAIFYREHNKYHLFKNGIEYIIRAHRMKNGGSIVNTGHLKMIVNASSKLTLMSVVASEDQVQAESCLQPVMVKEDLNDSFSNGVLVQGIQKVDTFSISSVILVLLLLFQLVGMWMMDVTVETGGCMVACINSVMAFFIMCLMVQIFRIPVVCIGDTGRVGQKCPNLHLL